ncbi:hypothetical protein [Acidomonas methanolica]|uniref:hypothetical protein n=1 Tax=Acidomonas methanolica TaxID=437 RepID=UPI002119F577|nr:hypothetical protein [Acidomonas methanolica]MCQ9156856.1 hypothetical protein [Acidomonas methanolica]
MLTLKRFKTLADAYGASLARWPAAVQKEARVLAETSIAARAILDEQRCVDAFIDQALEAEAQAYASQASQEDADAALARLRAGVAGRIGRQGWKGTRFPAIDNFGFGGRLQGWAMSPGGAIVAQRISLTMVGLAAMAVGWRLGWTTSSGTALDLFGPVLSMPLGSAD